MSNFETVHTMTGYYDGPREGIADFCGVPHVYESMYADVADKPGVANDVFRLSSVTPEVFELALEAWAIWLRWETAFHRGELTPDDAHPALLVDRVALTAYQDANDVLMAAQTLKRAFATDVTPILARARDLKGAAVDPVAAFRRSGYREHCAAHRPANSGARSGIV